MFKNMSRNFVPVHMSETNTDSSTVRIRLPLQSNFSIHQSYSTGHQNKLTKKSFVPILFTFEMEFSMTVHKSDYLSYLLVICLRISFS